MGEFINVYPKAIVFCPKSQMEQDMDLCCNCENYGGIDIEDDLFHIECMK